MSFVEARDRLRKYISLNSKWIIPVIRAIIILSSILAIDYCIGYAPVIGHPLVAIIVSVICAFIPLTYGTIFVVAFAFIHLYALSIEVAAASAVFFGLLYVVCAFYQTKTKNNLIYTPIAMQFKLPFVMNVSTALFGEARDLIAVLCGGVLAFFLKAVKDNASLFLDESVDISVMDIVSEKMISNHMFYIYLVSLIVMFAIIYSVRNLNISNAWIKALTFGVLSELVIMLAGYLFTSNISSIPWHLAGNAITYLAGIVMVYLYRDLDFTRVERVQFEDDEYYYHVTAIPKINLAMPDRQVKRVTNYRSQLGIKALQERSRKNKKGDKNWVE